MVAAAVVRMAIRLRVDPRLLVERVREVALDLPGNPVAAGGLGREDHLERVVGVLRPRDRRPPRLDAVDEMPEPLRPPPVRIALGEEAPGRLVVPPELPPLGSPVVAEQLDRPLAA